MESVLDVPRNPPLKFIKIGPVAAKILLTLSLCGWWVVVVVTAEIFFIWINVTWTNVPVTV